MGGLGGGRLGPILDRDWGERGEVGVTSVGVLASATGDFLRLGTGGGVVSPSLLGSLRAGIGGGAADSATTDLAGRGGGGGDKGNFSPEGGEVVPEPDWLLDEVVVFPFASVLAPPSLLDVLVAEFLDDDVTPEFFEEDFKEVPGFFEETRLFPPCLPAGRDFLREEGEG